MEKLDAERSYQQFDMEAAHSAMGSTLCRNVGPNEYGGSPAFSKKAD
jgi:hypothetical protein